MLAVLGGLFLSGFPASVEPTIADAGSLAFPAIILGGLDSPVGARRLRRCGPSAGTRSAAPPGEDQLAYVARDLFGSCRRGDADGTGTEVSLMVGLPCPTVQANICTDCPVTRPEPSPARPAGRGAGRPPVRDVSLAVLSRSSRPSSLRSSAVPRSRCRRGSAPRGSSGCRHRAPGRKSELLPSCG